MTKTMHCPDCRTERPVESLTGTNLRDPEGDPISVVRFTCGHSLSIS